MFYQNKKVAVVLMTWQRIPMLKETLNDLTNQTFQDFKLYISNGNLELKDHVNQYVLASGKYLDVDVSHDGNDLRSFRRFYAARKAVEDGADIVMFIDDDVELPPKYLEKMLKQYEPKTYKSGFAWTIHEGGIDYYKHRTRRFQHGYKIHYCGTGVSIIDGSIFLDGGLFNAPRGAMGIEDLWLSYYAQHILGWELAYAEMPKGTIIGGNDRVALFKTYLEADYTKADFLRELVQAGWKIEE